ncbi:MAG: hypothetical protein ACI841_000334 [Planctomycetota bacterium]|jgi:hypothetical protein
MPGAGGVNRGRADAEMSWGAESQGRSEDFDVKRLTPAQLEDLDSSQLLGLGAAVPTVEAAGESVGVGEISGSTGKAAWKRRLSPRHRRAVGTFFAPGSSASKGGADNE